MSPQIDLKTLFLTLTELKLSRWCSVKFLNKNTDADLPLLELRTRKLSKFFETILTYWFLLCWFSVRTNCKARRDRNLEVFLAALKLQPLLTTPFLIQFWWVGLWFCQMRERHGLRDHTRSIHTHWWIRTLRSILELSHTQF